MVMKIWTKNIITFSTVFFFFAFPLFAGETSRGKGGQASEETLLVKRLTRLLGSDVHYGGQLRGQTHVFKIDQEFDEVLTTLEVRGVILKKMAKAKDHLGPTAAEFELAVGVLDKRWQIHIENGRLRPADMNFKPQTIISARLLNPDTEDADETKKQKELLLETSSKKKLR